MYNYYIKDRGYTVGVATGLQKAKTRIKRELPKDAVGIVWELIKGDIYCWYRDSDGNKQLIRTERQSE